LRAFRFLEREGVIFKSAGQALGEEKKKKGKRKNILRPKKLLNRKKGTRPSFKIFDQRRKKYYLKSYPRRGEYRLGYSHRGGEKRLSACRKRVSGGKKKREARSGGEQRGKIFAQKNETE